MFLTCDNGLISAIFLRNLCVQKTKPVRSLRNLCVTIDQCAHTALENLDGRTAPHTAAMDTWVRSAEIRGGGGVVRRMGTQQQHYWKILSTPRMGVIG